MGHYDEMRERLFDSQQYYTEEEQDRREREEYAAELRESAWKSAINTDYSDYTIRDNINSPSHYTSYPGVEVIQLTEHMNFCRGNVIKYVARAEYKGNELEDLKKAQWYLTREITRLEERIQDDMYWPDDNDWVYAGE